MFELGRGSIGSFRESRRDSTPVRELIEARRSRASATLHLVQQLD